MIHPADFRDLVVAPTLRYLHLHSLAAEQLVLATAVHESGLRYLRQIGGGPALGFFQMEPATHRDIWNTYLDRKIDLTEKIAALSARIPPGAAQMATNAMYACAMCRIHYWRVPAPLPEPGDAQAMGRYWKRYYNTERGRGTVAAFVTSFEDHVRPLYA